jgi:hypothetical protein
MKEAKVQVRKIIVTEKEIVKILKDLPRYWKTIGEKRYVEDAYRYLMLHKELQETPEGKITFDYLKTRVVQLWCKETGENDKEWMLEFIDKLFNGQIQRTPALAERGRQYAELLLRQFKTYPDLAKKLLEYKSNQQ